MSFRRQLHNNDLFLNNKAEKIAGRNHYNSEQYPSSIMIYIWCFVQLTGWMPIQYGLISWINGRSSRYCI